MTHRGRFQHLPFCDSVIPSPDFLHVQNLLQKPHPTSDKWVFFCVFLIHLAKSLANAQQNSLASSYYSNSVTNVPIFYSFLFEILRLFIFWRDLGKALKCFFCFHLNGHLLASFRPWYLKTTLHYLWYWRPFPLFPHLLTPLS